MDGTADGFEPHRRRLAAIAYRMLGSVAEAEDVVQDAYLRWHGAARTDVDDPGAYLARIVTRLCLDRLKEARRRRETYVGPWLPEPVITGADAVDWAKDDVAADISYALLLALERLSPLERAAFLLHDVFDVQFDEVATILDRSPAACRQLASRARAHVRGNGQRFAVEPREHDAIADAFFVAARSGDSAALGRLLAETAMLHTDGGGRKVAALNVVTGGEKIVRFLVGIRQKAGADLPRFAHRLELNGLPALLSVEADGTMQTFALEMDAGRITAIYVTRNPDKLAHLTPLVPDTLRQ